MEEQVRGNYFNVKEKQEGSGKVMMMGWTSK
jgi:hypothetical protein